uniref:Adenylate kinase 7a n=1 Tax=Sphaeramia orbicularis TaxID=375764 RepID=A0A673CT24_9TELE
VYSNEEMMPKTKRVFVNNCAYVSFLSTCTREEDDADADEIVLSHGGEPAFHIVGTVSPTFKEERNSFLLEQYKCLSQSPTRDELLEHFLECDVVVYNISENATQQLIEEATWAITGEVIIPCLMKQMFCSQRKSTGEEDHIPISKTTMNWKSLCLNWVEV